MFRRTDSNPGEFNPIKSTIALAVTLLITLGLAQWYVSTKQGASNTIVLLESLKENGLSNYIPDSPATYYYMLYRDGQPIGFKYYEQSWKDNYLTGKEITSIPEESYLGRTDWNISNNTNTWIQKKQIISNGRRTTSEIRYSPGNIQYIIDNHILDTGRIKLRHNLIPPFMLDIYSSIGIKEFDQQIVFNFLQLGAFLSISIEPGSPDNIPMEFKTKAPNGIIVKSVHGDLTQDILYNQDHQLIYQKDSQPNPWDTIAIAEKSDIYQLWPEIEYIIPANTSEGGDL